MNKLAQMKKKLGMLAGIVAAVIAGAAGIMMVTGGMAESAVQRKNNADSALSQAQGQLNTMDTQLQQSGEAEKRFVELQLDHPNPDFSLNSDAMKAWMQEAKNRYRFSNSFKLFMALDKPTDKAELTNLNFDIAVRDPMRLDVGAMSDVHIYSFIEEMQRTMPGFVRITKMNLERKADMNASTFRQMLAGVNPEMVSGTIQFLWVGISPKAAVPAVESTQGGDPAVGMDAGGAPMAPPPGV